MNLGDFMREWRRNASTASSRWVVYLCTWIAKGITALIVLLWMASMPLIDVVGRLPFVTAANRDRLRHCVIVIIETCFRVTLVTIWIITLPYVITVKSLQDRKRRQEEKIKLGYVRTRPEPEPLPLQSLKRRVSRTDMNFASRDNENTGLMTLPWEIRQMIWKELGINEPGAVHWSVVNGRLKGELCLSEVGHYEKWWSTFHPYGPDRKFEVWGLMLSCRHLYIEMTQMLYKTKTFITADPDVLSYLDRHLPIQRRCEIRNLKFRWSLTRSPTWEPPPKDHRLGIKTPKRLEEAEKKRDPYQQAWFDVWRNLQRLEGLEYLRVDIEISEPRTGTWTRWSERDWKIVRELKDIKKFELVVPQEHVLHVKQVLEGTNVTLLEYWTEASRLRSLSSRLHGQ